MRCPKTRGYSLVEILFSLAILTLVVCIATPALLGMTRRLTLRAVAGRIRMILLTVRNEAELANCNRGVRFSRHGDAWSYAVYEDGDTDGVRNDDIRSGRDPLIRGPFVLLDESANVRVGLPPGPRVADPDGGPPLAPSAAVSFNGSSLCSFSPDGDGTPGTLYLTDGLDAAAVRCTGDGGHVYVLLYRARGGWHR
jgi:prepilin-type N-terminal cleavage/methylation domain-containing protein